MFSETIYICWNISSLRLCIPYMISALSCHHLETKKDQLCLMALQLQINENESENTYHTKISQTQDAKDDLNKSIRTYPNKYKENSVVLVCHEREHIKKKGSWLLDWRRLQTGNLWSYIYDIELCNYSLCPNLFVESRVSNLLRKPNLINWFENGA